MKTINVGLIGFGYIGKVHTIAYRDIPLCISRPVVRANLSALLRSQLETDRAAMEEAGYQLCTTSPEEFFTQPLELVDICTPNNQHFQQCQRALILLAQVAAKGFHGNLACPVGANGA